MRSPTCKLIFEPFCALQNSFTQHQTLISGWKPAEPHFAPCNDFSYSTAIPQNKETHVFYDYHCLLPHKGENVFIKCTISLILILCVTFTLYSKNPEPHFALDATFFDCFHSKKKDLPGILCRGCKRTSIVLKWSSVEFIKIPSAPKKLQIFMTE